MPFKESISITQVIFKYESSYLTEFKGEIMNIRSTETQIKSNSYHSNHSTPITQQELSGL